MTTFFQSIDPLFDQFVNTANAPEKIAGGLTWTEGPVWVDGFFYFNDIPAKKMYRWSQTEGLRLVVNDTDFANGNTVDLQHGMISCEHGGRRVIRRDDMNELKKTSVIVEKFEGKRLNSPNDVVVKSDGSIWFTDPPYGINSNIEGYPAESEIGSNNVYCIDASGVMYCVASNFDKPNGLAFSPDEKQLYIADSGAILGASFPGIDYSRPHHIRVFDVQGHSLCNDTVFVEIDDGVPDGLRVDTEGYVWSSSADSLRCYSPLGELIGKVLLPEVVSNCCFGGPTGTDLFITSTSSVYRVQTTCRGAESLHRY